ncbi:right-handed parallel beta-helix repeat-containing protein [Longispora sp. NPDC051575]|uniref:right-handed parallel beta-helix repeat-containing protein n=1 Tax=Longispora sp. NPDC051575 TaxID=3154943 RepID=UPI0034239FEC
MRRPLLLGTLVVALTAGVSVPATTASAATTDLFVNNTVACADTGPGSQAQPFCTLAAAAAAVTPGGTVRGTGTYNERLTVVSSGTPGSPVTFRGANPDVADFFLTGDKAGVTIAGQHDVSIANVQVTAGAGGPAVTVDNASRVTLDKVAVRRDNLAPVPGISLTGVTDSSLAKVSVAGALVPAISLDAATSGVVVTGARLTRFGNHRHGGIVVLGSRNSVLYSTLSAARADAITVGAGATDNVVARNNVYETVRRGIVNAGATGTAITNNTVNSGNETNIRVDGASTGVSVQNNVVRSTACAACDLPQADKAVIGVYGDAVSGTTVDYNTVQPSANGPRYVWGATPYFSVAEFRAASGQGAHDRDSSEPSPNFDSANSAAPGWQPTDAGGRSPVDNPDVPNTGAGPFTYADRGTSEISLGPTAALTLTSRPDAGVVADASGTKPGWVPIVSYTFDFGDGTTVTQATPVASHTYATRDRHDIRVTVTDAQRLAASTSKGYEPGGYYVPLGPVRALDTRAATGTSGTTPVAPGGTLTLQVTGRLGVPETGVTSVTMNVTATQPTRDGFLTVYPHGGSTPNASNLNWVPGLTVPNLVVVQVADGKVDFRNTSAGTVHLVADLVGYHTTGPGASHVPVPLTRVLDTRDATGTTGTAPVAPGGTLTLQVTGRAGVPDTGVTAVSLNVTVTEPGNEGFLTVSPNGRPRPNASNLNWNRGVTVPNLVVVPVVNGKVDFHNTSAGTVHVVADLAGYHSTGGGAVFHPASPFRVLDTRDANGGRGSPVYQGAWTSVNLRSLVPEGTTGVFVNVTVTGPTGDGFLTVLGRFGSAPTATSNLNWRPGQTVANLVYVELSDGDTIFINTGSGTVHVIADVVGTYSA